MTHAGHILRITGNTWWCCPNESCRHKLGKLVGPRLVIRVSGLQLSLTLTPDTEITCPRCGTVSTIQQEEAA